MSSKSPWALRLFLSVKIVSKTTSPPYSTDLDLLWLASDSILSKNVFSGKNAKSNLGINALDIGNTEANYERCFYLLF